MTSTPCDLLPWPFLDGYLTMVTPSAKCCFLCQVLGGLQRGNPPQYSCLENTMDRGAWSAIVHGVAKSGTWLSESAQWGFLDPFAVTTQHQVYISAVWFCPLYGAGSVCVSHSAVCGSATPWTVTQQASLSMGFSRQECWSGLPCPSPGNLPEPGVEPGSHALQADSLPSEPLQFSSVAQSC